jgi:hypothetical protein
MFNNAAHRKNVSPSTRAEYEALRVAGGDGPAENPGDGSRIDQLVVGIKKRYGWQAARIGPPGAAHPTFTVLWDKLDPGYGAVVQGWMGVWSRESYWRRWDRNFGGAHAVYVQRRDSTDRVWWMNPLAPNSYPGEWMTKTELKKYWDGFFGGATWVRVGSLAPLPDTSEEPLDDFSIFEHPSIAEAVRATKLWTKSNLTGTSYDIPAGHTKRAIGNPKGDKTVLIIGHDRSPEIPGKSGLFGKAADWRVTELP